MRTGCESRQRYGPPPPAASIDIGPYNSFCTRTTLREPKELELRASIAQVARFAGVAPNAH